MHLVETHTFNETCKWKTDINSNLTGLQNVNSEMFPGHDPICVPDVCIGWAVHCLPCLHLQNLIKKTKN